MKSPNYYRLLLDYKLRFFSNNARCLWMPNTPWKFLCLKFGRPDTGVI